MENAVSSTSPMGHVLRTPVGITIVRVLQVVISLGILGLTIVLMLGTYLDEFGLVTAMHKSRRENVGTHDSQNLCQSIITLIVVVYDISTEKITAWNGAYHVIAVLVLDALLVIMWLAAFAAAAARRSTYPVRCYEDSYYGTVCLWKRTVEKRDLTAQNVLDMFSAIAGLGALVWLLSIVTFIYTLVKFLRGRKNGGFPVRGGSSGIQTLAYQMNPKTDQTAPVMMQQQQQQQPPQPLSTPSPMSPPPQQHPPQEPIHSSQQV